jgi:hypothetical protein
LQANEFGEIEYPTVVLVIEWIDNVVVVFFSAEYLIRFGWEWRYVVFFSQEYLQNWFLLYNFVVFFY